MAIMEVGNPVVWEKRRGLGVPKGKPSSKLELTKWKITTISPFEKSKHPSHMDPSLFDVMLVDGYVPMIFFYRVVNTPEAHSAFVDRLKLSLSKVLVSYYNMAGRWVKTYDSTIRRLHCNDEGVPFIEGFINEDMDVVVGLNKDQDRHGFEPSSLLSGFELVGLDSSKFNQISEVPMPSVFVQVTRFKCSSVAVCATFNHMTADGRSMTDFLKAWSEELRGGDSSIVPCHDKSHANISVWDYWPRPKKRSFPSEEESVAGRETSPAPRVDLGIALRAPETTPLFSKFLSVRRSVIDGLKREAARNNIELTTLDCVQAHVWRSIANLQASFMGKNSTETVVGTWVDGRKRFPESPLPEGYSSNFSILNHFPVIMDSAQLSDFETAASLVHASVQAVTSKTYRGVVRNLLEFMGQWSSWQGRHLIISSWHKFPMYDIDFGLGKPFLTGMNSNFDFLPMGLCMIHPAPPGSEYVAVVQLAICAEVHEALLADDSFLSFFA